MTASKADWLAGTTWLGFTPTGDGQNAHAQCQSTIRRQFGDGYVIEYITANFGQPNAGFESDPGYLQELADHEARAGRLVAVHKLRATARSLRTILGDEEFNRLQSMWANPNNRRRWSVAFPIIESYEIVDPPLARDVFGQAAYQRLYGHSSATLRPLNAAEMKAVNGIEIRELTAINAWIGIADEFPAAERSQIDKRLERDVNTDLGARAPEGMTDEKWGRVRRRAAWLADRFARQRRDEGRWRCEVCSYEPANLPELEGLRHRSLLDVHHRRPLEEGRRYTTVGDFDLLCPTCHRVVHARLRANRA